jgi:chloride channel protein, CIC family
VILGVLIVKSIIWSVSLGSGTSGGVLAPLLMMGGALGGIEAWALPAEGVGFWPLVSMGAILGGTMRSPLTGVVFALELTHDVNMMLPLLVAVTVAHGFTVLILRRSILTEKIARRGYHLSREYAVDALPADAPYDAVRRSLHVDATRGVQRLYPVVGKDNELIGVVTRHDLQALAAGAAPYSATPLAAVVKAEPTVAYPDESLRAVVYRMAETGLTRFPVVDRAEHRLIGMVALTDLLKARALNLDAERRRERVLGARIAFPFGNFRRKRERIDT